MGKFFLAFVVFTSTLFSQADVKTFYSAYADSIFKSGVEFFNAGIVSRNSPSDTLSNVYFKKAEENFSSVFSLGFNHRTTASYLMLAKSLIYQNRFNDAVGVLEDFIRRFPESTYIEDARYTLGLAYFGLGLFQKAFDEFSYLLESSKGEGSESYEKVFTAILDSIEIPILQKILKGNYSDDIRFRIVLKVAERLASAKGADEAKKFLSEQLAEFRDSEFYKPILTKINYYDRLLLRPKVKIGVLLPKERKFARSILNGIEIAINEHNMNSSPKIGIETLFYSKDDVDQKLLSFKNSPDVIAIIGPIYSEDIELCARFADRVGIPLVSPTAMSDSLTKLSKYIFQANSDYSTRARSLAQFGIFALGLKYFAIIAPNDRIIKPFVDAFSDEVRKNSALLVDIQWYPPTENDLRSYFLNIKSKIDTQKIPTDSLGLFAPILKNDYIGIITAQVYYHDLKVKVFGNDVWNDFNELYSNRPYTDGVIFTSGIFADRNSTTFWDFSSLYRERFSDEPDDYALYGYDVARALAKIVSEGSLTSDEVRVRLIDFEYSGVGKSFIFNDERVNSSVLILTFKNNLVSKITEWNTSK